MKKKNEKKNKHSIKFSNFILVFPLITEIIYLFDHLLLIAFFLVDWLC